MGGTEKLNASIQKLNDSSKEVSKLINNITDELSFVELDRFIYSDSLLGNATGEGVMSGFASINGINVALWANNPQILMGSIGKRGAEKIAKLINNAVKTSAPVIGILDTSGARFSEGIEALEGYGKIFKALSSAYGSVPVICVVKGNNFGLSSYLTSISDCCIAYDKSVLSTSSPLILSAKANTDIKNVGTAAIHSQKSGVYSAVVKNDAELKNTLSSVIDILSQPVVESDDDPNRVCENLSCGAKAIELINGVFDKNSFVELRKDYAPAVITGFARLNGVAVGIVANNFEINEGRINTAAAIKISQFLNVCYSHEIPLVNLVNSSGVVCALNEENDSLIRETADLMYLYNEISQAKIALIYGNAFGAAYTMFAGSSVCDYTLAWPCAKVGVTDSKSAAELLYADEIAKAENKQAVLEKLSESYCDENLNALTVSKFGYIDNVIDPVFSRQYLINAVQMFLNKE